MAGSIKIDDALFESKIRRMLRELGKDEGEFIQEQGKAMASNLMNGIPPFESPQKIIKTTNPNKRDLAVGKKAIADDLRRCMEPRPRGFVEFLMRRFGGQPGDYQLRKSGGEVYNVRYDAISTSISEAEAWHQRQRSPRTGRVKRNALKMIVPYDVYEEVGRNLMDNVGMAKASAAKAVVQLGGKNPPKWIKQHMAMAKGSARFQRRKSRPRVTITLSTHALSALRGRLPFLQRFRSIAMEKRLKFLLRKAVNKSKL